MLWTIFVVLLILWLLGFQSARGGRFHPFAAGSSAGGFGD